MPEKTYIVRFKPPETSVQPALAAKADVVDGYLVLFREDGTVAAFFDINFVEDWSTESPTN